MRIVRQNPAANIQINSISKASLKVSSAISLTQIQREFNGLILSIASSLALPAKFKKVDNLISLASEYIENGGSRLELKKLINGIFGRNFLTNTIQGQALLKPYGYAGDFDIIDKIYTERISPIEEYSFWDKYFHCHSAPRAVRNRKAYFKNLLGDRIGDSEFELLNIASGPGRDVKELYDMLDPDCKLQTTCVEMDERAINFAQFLNRYHLDKIKFIHKNIFKFRSDKEYHMIWSSGLFDYFDDKAFVIVLRKIKEWVISGGEIVIGNFNEDHNPSRSYMEIFGEWYLHHRTESQLIDLAVQSGFNRLQASVKREPRDVNLFLHIRC